MSDTPRRLVAEGLGTALLLAVVIGSGIMAERLAPGQPALALLANALATAAGLYVLIELFGPLSGAHFNPAVSFALAREGALPWPLLVPYVAAQLVGAVLGAWLAHAMFDLGLLQGSTHVRSSAGQWIAETVATFGLVLLVLRGPPARMASMVGAYIGAAYWFTSSTAFANPAAAWGRMFTDSFAGIAPASVPAFIAAEGLGTVLALGLHRLLGPAAAPRAGPAADSLPSPTHRHG